MRSISWKENDHVLNQLNKLLIILNILNKLLRHVLCSHFLQGLKGDSSFLLIIIDIIIVWILCSSIHFILHNRVIKVEFWSFISKNKDENTSSKSLPFFYFMKFQGDYKIHINPKFFS